MIYFYLINFTFTLIKGNYVCFIYCLTNYPFEFRKWALAFHHHHHQALK